jgi:hypothetical protein
MGSATAAEESDRRLNQRKRIASCEKISRRIQQLKKGKKKNIGRVRLRIETLQNSYAVEFMIHVATYVQGGSVAHISSSPPCLTFWVGGQHFRLGITR